MIDKITMEFARRDDCLDLMVPSDLRLILADKRVLEDTVDTQSRHVVELEDRIKALESAREWTSVEDGMPGEAGMYLCAFSYGSVESFYIDCEDLASGGWSNSACCLTHWTANPAHPGGE